MSGKGEEMRRNLLARTEKRIERAGKKRAQTEQMSRQLRNR